VRRNPGGREDGVRAPDRWHPLDTHDAVDAEPDPGSEAGGDPEPAEDPAASDKGSGRLGRGALAAMVRDYLAAMAERGEAVLVADKPRRYASPADRARSAPARCPAARDTPPVVGVASRGTPRAGAGGTRGYPAARTRGPWR
jgi:hypothetical protein